MGSHVCMARLIPDPAARPRTIRLQWLTDPRPAPQSAGRPGHEGFMPGCALLRRAASGRLRRLRRSWGRCPRAWHALTHAAACRACRAASPGPSRGHGRSGIEGGAGAQAGRGGARVRGRAASAVGRRVRPRPPRQTRECMRHMRQGLTRPAACGIWSLNAELNGPPSAWT